ncbi:MAG: hypothetical protein ACYTEL_15505 [Planctomycetota bacterium]|jgi:hypothetical protein
MIKTKLFVGAVDINGWMRLVCWGVMLLGVVAGCDRSPEGGASETVPDQRSRSESVSAGARERLLARINRNGDFNDPNVPRPLVTLEEFFEGNDDYGSIGYNFYPDQPAPAEFYRLFRRIRDKAAVDDVRVEVKDLEDPGGWPATDTVWIITEASPDDVKKWLGDRFRADDILRGFPMEGYYRTERYDLPDGMQAIGVWWD